MLFWPLWPEGPSEPEAPPWHWLVAVRRLLASCWCCGLAAGCDSAATSESDRVCLATVCVPLLFTSRGRPRLSLSLAPLQSRARAREGRLGPAERGERREASEGERRAKASPPSRHSHRGAATRRANVNRHVSRGGTPAGASEANEAAQWSRATGPLGSGCAAQAARGASVSLPREPDPLSREWACR